MAGVGGGLSSGGMRTCVQLCRILLLLLLLLLLLWGDFHLNVDASSHVSCAAASPERKGLPMPHRDGPGGRAAAGRGCHVSMDDVCRRLLSASACRSKLHAMGLQKMRIGSIQGGDCAFGRDEDASLHPCYVAGTTTTQAEPALLL